jgi:Fur family iron response transcriptional regulator
MNADWSSVSLHSKLQQAGVLPTLQRLTVAAVLLTRPAHMTAEQVLNVARAQLPDISRATVYSTLQLFVRHGLLRELLIDGVATVYDSNLAPHHHFYNLDTGEVSDMPAQSLQVLGLPELAGDLELAEIDVVVRVRSRKSADAATRA